MMGKKVGLWQSRTIPQAKLLNLCRRTFQDIHTAVAFLCTRVKSLDEDVYGILKISN